MATEDDEHRSDVDESIRKLLKRESEKLNHLNQSNVTICMVPDTLRNLNPSAYTPRIISIGPLHKEDKHLTAMEERKVNYMYALFCRIEKSGEEDLEQISHQCVQAVRGLVTQARACYGPSFTTYNDFKLAEMMVIDGCFILELLYRLMHGIAEGDPIFDNNLMIHDVKHDLLLLENQIPFFILEILFPLTLERIWKVTTLAGYISYFFNEMNILNSTLDLNTQMTDPCHILGLLQSCYSCFRPKPTNQGPVTNEDPATNQDPAKATNQGPVPTNSYPATEIAGAGVTFKPNTDGSRLLEVRFKHSYLVPWLVRKTRFEIPVLCIKDSTASFLRNLIAYELCYPISRHYVTSFAILMDRLIDTKADVELLVRSKVLEHKLGATEDVTNLFNNICNGVVLDNVYYADEWAQLDKHCNRFWPGILISLRRTYISTTWKTLTVIAAVILFVLTLVQTIYAIRSA